MIHLIRNDDPLSSPRASLIGSADTASVPRLARQLDSILAEDHPELLLDLSGLSYIGSAGLRLLLQVHDQLGLRGGGLWLHGQGPLIQEILGISGLDRILATESSAERAA